MRRKGLVAALLAVCVALPATAASVAESGWGLPQLAQLLAQNSGGTLAFTEYKYLQALKLPLRVQGTVSFTPPDRIERIVTQPRPERFVVDNGLVTISKNGGSEHVVQLAQYPQLQAFVSAFTATLNGQLQALQKNFTTVVSGNAEAWALKLTPARAALADTVEQMVITGAAAQILSFEVKQANGDRSVMQLSPLPTPLPAG